MPARAELRLPCWAPHSEPCFQPPLPKLLIHLPACVWHVYGHHPAGLTSRGEPCSCAPHPSASSHTWSQCPASTQGDFTAYLPRTPLSRLSQTLLGCGHSSQQLCHLLCKGAWWGLQTVGLPFTAAHFMHSHLSSTYRLPGRDRTSNTCIYSDLILNSC